MKQKASWKFAFNVGLYKSSLIHQISSTFALEEIACNSGNNFEGNDVRADEQGLYKSAEGVVNLRYSAPFQPVNEIDRPINSSTSHIKYR